MSNRKPFPSSRGAAFGPLEQVFDDVWWAWGTTRFLPGATFSRNMIVLRGSDGLVLIHPVMLPEAEQTKLDALGPIRHIVRLGDFHGMDDALYVERYRPRTWAPPGVTPHEGVRVDEALVPGGATPLEGATLVSYERSSSPETVLHVPRHGGLLLSCDSVQSWERMPDGVSFLGTLMARAMGFRGRSCLGPGWRRQCEPKDGVGFGPDYRRILDLEFRHLLSAHGPPVKDTARDDLRAVVDATYPRA